MAEKEGKGLPDTIKRILALCAMRLETMDNTDDSINSDNEDLYIGDRKPVAKGYVPFPNTQKKMDKSRSSKMTPPKDEVNEAVLKRPFLNGCVVQSAKRPKMNSLADYNTESDNEDLDTQKKMDKSRCSKLAPLKNEVKEGVLKRYVVNGCVVQSAKRPKMNSLADYNTESDNEDLYIGDRKPVAKGYVPFPNTQKKMDKSRSSKMTPLKNEVNEAVLKRPFPNGCVVQSAKRPEMNYIADDNNEDLYIGDRKPVAKGYVAFPSTQKNMDKSRTSKMALKNEVDDGVLKRHFLNGCVVQSAKRPEMNYPANDSKESDNEDLDIGDRKPCKKGVTTLLNTQKKLEKNRNSKLSPPENAKEGDVMLDVVNGCIALSAKRTVMVNRANNSTESVSLSYSQAMSDKNLMMNDETRLSPNDKVHDIPYLPLQKLSGHAGDMKAEFDQTEAVSVHKQLVQLAASVGLIRSPSGCGTGFHVGPGYIMTAKHVVDLILKGAPVLIRQQKQIFPHPQLSSQNVFIDFSYERNGQTSNESLRFYFEPLLVYENDHLDTVILKLKRDPNKMYPPHLNTFAQLPNDAHSGYLIGHSNADVKKTDKYQRVTLAPQTLKDASEWSRRHAKVDGYFGIDDPRRILLHCSFNKGASGAPGFWIRPNDTRAYVVLMLLRGYPDWYYDDKYKQEQKIGIPPKCLIEQGVSMASISEDMQKRDPSLWQKIFCCSDADEKMVE